MWWHDEEIPGDERPDRALPFGEMMRRVAPLFRPHRRLLAGGVTLMLVSVGAELAGPVVLWRLFDVAIPEGSRGALLSGGLLFALFFLVGIAATYLQIVLVTRMGLAIVTDLKKRLFDHLLHLSLAYFDRHPPGVLLARVESDAERLQALFSEVSVSVVRTVVMIAGAFAVMSFASWKITLILLALIVPLGVGTWFFFRWLRPLFRSVRRAYARISGFVAEYVQGVGVLQAFGYEPRALERLRALNEDKAKLEFRSQLLEYGFWGLLNSMEVVAVMMILAAAGLDLLPGIVLTPGLVVLFVDLTRRLFWPLAMFSEQLNFIQRAFASADRVFAVLDTPSRTPDRPGARETVPDDWREIRFENVSFAYDGGTLALDDVSFAIPRGRKLALVGLSGGGKTTITNLLLRFYEPTGGRITLDGVDLRDVRQHAWRRRMGLVLQDIHLFPGTVGENLRALLDDVDPEALARAVSIVGAEEVIARLPGGYDALLTEGGTNLSMGERQLLSFARAIVRDPDLLVLDEATSAVDPTTERQLQRSLDRLLHGRTALIIAHRLATVVNADRILVVHQGRVVEEGTHDELYARDGIYRDLFDLQFREGEAA